MDTKQKENSEIVKYITWMYGIPYVVGAQWENPDAPVWVEWTCLIPMDRTVGEFQMDPQEAMRQHLRKEVLAMFVDPDDLEVKAMIEHAVRSMQVLPRDCGNQAASDSTQDHS
jgi:hypothetical protein